MPPFGLPLPPRLEASYSSLGGVLPSLPSRLGDLHKLVGADHRPHPVAASRDYSGASDRCQRVYKPMPISLNLAQTPNIRMWSLGQISKYLVLAALG